MMRSVSTLPLGSQQLSLLVDNGFTNLESLEGLKPLDICRALKCSQEQALEIWKSMQPLSESYNETAKVLY
jgi:hypothetical protein